VKERYYTASFNRSQRYWATSMPRGRERKQWSALLLKKR
jgi:hypothetical protein